MAARKKAPPGEWTNRIVGYGEEPAESFLANPLNGAKLHPVTQQRAMSAMLDDVGFVAPVVVNKRTGFLLDGHMRVSLALASNGTVPVCYVDLTPEEEAKIVMTFDPVGSMAAFDTDLLGQIMADIEIPSSDLQSVLDKLCENRNGEGRNDDPEPPEDPEPKESKGKDGKPEGTSSLLLFFDDADYDELVARLETIQGDSNSDKVAYLIRSSTPNWR